MSLRLPLAGLLPLAVLVTAQSGYRSVATATPPDLVDVAPPPRDVEFTRVYRGSFTDAEPAGAGAVYQLNGVEWKVTLKVRRLVSSGRDVIDFDWSIRYTGPRPPLIILSPSLTESWPRATQAHIFAFPTGSDAGRRVVFGTPETAGGGLDQLVVAGTPKEWFLRVPRGRRATGTETLAVADVKRELLEKYPAEFSDTRPPKLYAEFNHETWERGVRHDFDAWTGILPSSVLDVPELERW